jgi:hypothetical protein
MLTLKHIKALNIEISSKCIGKCPFCSRDQKIRPYGNHVITFADFKKLPGSLIKQLKMARYILQRTELFIPAVMLIACISRNTMHCLIFCRH